MRSTPPLVILPRPLPCRLRSDGWWLVDQATPCAGAVINRSLVYGQMFRTANTIAIRPEMCDAASAGPCSTDNRELASFVGD